MIASFTPSLHLANRKLSVSVSNMVGLIDLDTHLLAFTPGRIGPELLAALERGDAGFPTDRRVIHGLHGTRLNEMGRLEQCIDSTRGRSECEMVSAG
jgi:hypothetical protein